MLHTLRQIVDDDVKWRTILRGLNSTFYHQTVTSKQIEEYLSQEVGLDLNSFFDQYLRDVRIPTLEYFFKDGHLSYKWANCVPGFNMPLKVTLNGTEKLLNPKTEWSRIDAKIENIKLEVDKNFYVACFNVGE